MRVWLTFVPKDLSLTSKLKPPLRTSCWGSDRLISVNPASGRYLVQASMHNDAMDDMYMRSDRLEERPGGLTCCLVLCGEQTAPAVCRSNAMWGVVHMKAY